MPEYSNKCQNIPTNAGIFRQMLEYSENDGTRANPGEIIFCQNIPPFFAAEYSVRNNVRSNTTRIERVHEKERK